VLKFDDYELRMLFSDEIFEGERGNNPTQYLYIKTRVEKYGMLWAVAAAVDGSIGYYTYDIAKDLIESVLGGEPFCSERTLACRHGDARYELALDLYCMEEATARDKEKVKYLMEFVKRLKGLDWVTSATISAIYPTLSITP
jgi:hypothetical protein